jgi:hypothetical protein
MGCHLETIAHGQCPALWPPSMCSTSSITEGADSRYRTPLTTSSISSTRPMGVQRAHPRVGAPRVGFGSWHRSSVARMPGVVATKRFAFQRRRTRHTPRGTALTSARMRGKDAQPDGIVEAAI